MASPLQALQERKMKRLSLLTLVITQFLSADVVSSVYVPHLADGTLRFHAEDGSPLPLLTVGSTTGPASSLLISVPANGIVVVETTGTSTATALGWAELIVSASNSLAVSTIFRQHVEQHPDFEASIVAST